MKNMKNQWLGPSQCKHWLNGISTTNRWSSQESNSNFFVCVSLMLYHFVSAEVLIICPVKNELVVYTLYVGPRNRDKEI